MGLKKVLPYLFLSVLFTIWLFLLLAVYIPTTSWGTPTFPLKIDPNLKTMFLASTVFLVLTSFLMSMEKLGLLSRIASFLGYRRKE
jgi:hypothetical protein